MRRTCAAALAALALGLGTTAGAADDVGKWYVAPMVWGIWTGSERVVDDDFGFGAQVGKHFNDRFSLELGFNRGRFDAPLPQNELRLEAYSLDLLWHFYRQSRIHPYYTLGFVRTRENRPATGSQGSSMIQAGLGLMTQLHSNEDRSRVLHLRGEAKGRWTVIETAGNPRPADFLAGIGLQYSFGRPAPIAPISQEQALAPEPMPEPAPEPEPAPAPPADSDGDGVPDDQDKCPGTPPGAKVDAHGCEIEEIVLKGVNFDFDSARLRADSTEALDQLVALLRQRPGVTAEIRGHTDSVGNDAYNQRLSERRAQSVRQYLVDRGIPAESLEARGYGETRPIASNDTEEGRAENRRVTIQFTAIAQR